LWEQNKEYHDDPCPFPVHFLRESRISRQRPVEQLHLHTYICTMKKILLVFSVLLLASCSEKDTICACIEAGDKLNLKANAILENGSTSADEKELQALKADKKKKCAEFETMGGEEMKKRMEDCDN
jgi:hypothetical protein